MPSNFSDHNILDSGFLLFTCICFSSITWQPVEENYANPKTCFFHVLFKVIAVIILCCFWELHDFISPWLIFSVFSDRPRLWHFTCFQRCLRIVLLSSLWSPSCLLHLIFGWSRMLAAVSWWGLGGGMK